MIRFIPQICRVLVIPSSLLALHHLLFLLLASPLLSSPSIKEYLVLVYQEQEDPLSPPGPINDFSKPSTLPALFPPVHPSSPLHSSPLFTSPPSHVSSYLAPNFLRTANEISAELSIRIDVQLKPLILSLFSFCCYLL